MPTSDYVIVICIETVYLTNAHNTYNVERHKEYSWLVALFEQGSLTAIVDINNKVGQETWVTTDNPKRALFGFMKEDIKRKLSLPQVEYLVWSSDRYGDQWMREIERLNSM